MNVGVKEGVNLEARAHTVISMHLKMISTSVYASPRVPPR